MAAFTQTVVDNFNDNSLSGTLWPATAGAVAETSQTLRLTVGTGAGADSEVDGAAISLSGGSKWYGCKLVTHVAQASLDDVPIQLVDNVAFTFVMRWRITNTTAVAEYSTNGGSSMTSAGSTFTYSAGTHVYFAVGINAAGQWSWMWSTDGVNFTEHATITAPTGTVTFLPLILAFRNAAGGSSATLVYDDFSSWVPSAGGGGTPLPVFAATYRRRRQ